jgi:hypothetical protein
MLRKVGKGNKKRPPGRGKRMLEGVDVVRMSALFSSKPC